MMDEQDEDELFARLAKNLEAVRQDAALARTRGADAMSAGLARVETELRNLASITDGLRERVERQDALNERLEAAAADGQADIQGLHQTVEALSRRLRQHGEVIADTLAQRSWPRAIALFGVVLGVLMAGAGAAGWTAAGREPSIGMLADRAVAHLAALTGIGRAGPGERAQSPMEAQAADNPEPPAQSAASPAAGASVAPAPDGSAVAGAGTPGVAQPAQSASLLPPAATAPTALPSPDETEAGVGPPRTAVPGAAGSQHVETETAAPLPAARPTTVSAALPVRGEAAAVPPMSGTVAATAPSPGQGAVGATPIAETPAGRMPPAETQAATAQPPVSTPATAASLPAAAALIATPPPAGAQLIATPSPAATASTAAPLPVRAALITATSAAETPSTVASLPVTAARIAKPLAAETPSTAAPLPTATPQIAAPPAATTALAAVSLATAARAGAAPSAVKTAGDAKPSTAAVPPNAQSETPVAVEAALAPPARAPPATRQVVLRATADTWVQVRQNGGPLLLSRTMNAGETWPVPAEPGLLLDTGNAKGLVLEVEGVATRLTGAKGIVIHNVLLDTDLLGSGAVVRLGQ